MTRAIAILGALLLAGCASGRAAPAAATAPPTAYAAPGTGMGTTPVLATPPTGAPAFTFRFQVGDELSVDVWQEKELSTKQRVLLDGTISPPLLGTVPIVGLTIDEVATSLKERYRTYLKDPQVSVRVDAIHSDRIFVLGEVRTPQAVPLVGPTTLVQGIAQAGGYVEEFADKGRVRLIRKGPDGRPLIACVNTQAILGGMMMDPPLQRGDIVFVPARGVTNWSRTLGQALSPFSVALGAAGAAAAIVTATP